MKKTKAEFIVCKNKAGQHIWKLRAANGMIVARQETPSGDRQAVKRQIARLCKQVQEACVVASD